MVNDKIVITDDEQNIGVVDGSIFFVSLYDVLFAVGISFSENVIKKIEKYNVKEIQVCNIATGTRFHVTVEDYKEHKKSTDKPEIYSLPMKFWRIQEHWEALAHKSEYEKEKAINGQKSMF